MTAIDTMLHADAGAAPTASRARGFLRGALDRLVAWDARHRRRRHLAGLDAPALADCGLGEADVAAEAAKPFWRA